MSETVDNGAINLADYLTPQQVAERRDVSLPAVYKAIERGVLPTLQVPQLGRRRLIKISDADAYTPGSYGDEKRAPVKRGPGRPRGTGRTETEQPS